MLMLLFKSSERLISPSGLDTPMTVMVRKTHTVSVLYHYNKHLLLQELERKVNQTAPFKNLKQMLLKKNNQIRELRSRLSR